MTAARRPPSSDPAKVQFFRPTATARSVSLRRRSIFWKTSIVHLNAYHLISTMAC